MHNNLLREQKQNICIFFSPKLLQNILIDPYIIVINVFFLEMFCHGVKKRGRQLHRQPLQKDFPKNFQHF